MEASAELLLELIREQRQQEASGVWLKADNHKLSEIALLLSKAMREFPPSCSVPQYDRPKVHTPPTEEVRMDVE